MKKLILVSVLLSLIFGVFSVVTASDCDFDGYGYTCNLWDTCQALSCECDGTNITGGQMCWTVCTFDWYWYSCNDGDYCDSPDVCECDWADIDSWTVCNGSNPTAPISCTHAWETFFVWQSVHLFSKIFWATLELCSI